MEFFGGEGRRSGLVLDPRTKLALMLVLSTVLITGGGGRLADANRLVLTALPLILLASGGNIATTLRFVVLYAAAYSAEFIVLPRLTGLAGFIAVATIGVITRMLPAVTMGRYLVATTTVSEFSAAMERMRVSPRIVIPFSVMFRFFPTIAEEARSINEAMRMRGVTPLSLEYRVVPLMMSTVKIGEELSAAAITRGLGGPARRTNICEIGFKAADAAVLVVAAACLASHLLGL